MIIDFCMRYAGFSCLEMAMLWLDDAKSMSFSEGRHFIPSEGFHAFSSTHADEDDGKCCSIGLAGQ